MSRRVRQDLESELNLAPFIDVFMTLIAFVLLSTVFVHLSHLKVHTPGSSLEEGGPSDGLQIFAELTLSGIQIKAYDLKNQTEREDLSFSGALTNEAFQMAFEKLAPSQRELKGVLLKGRTNGSVKETLQVVEAFRSFDSNLPIVIVTEGLQ